MKKKQCNTKKKQSLPSDQNSASLIIIQNSASRNTEDNKLEGKLQAN